MQGDLTSSGPFGSWKRPLWQGKGSMDSRPGLQRIEQRLLEPTYSAPWQGATAAACGTDEDWAAVHDVFGRARQHPQTSAPPSLSMSSS